MDTEEQPYDDRHGPRPKAVDPLGMQFRLSIPDAIDAVRDYLLMRQAINPRSAEAMRVITDELEARFNAEQRQVVDREIGGDDLQSAIDHLAGVIDTGQGSTSTLDAASVVLFALRQRMDDDIKQNEPTEPMPVFAARRGGLTYVDALGRFALTDLATARWTENAETFGTIDLRVLAAHLSTALDAVTAELELRRH